jgi:hypothetical protein
VSVEELASLDSDEITELLEWRMSVLTESGFTAEQAAVIAPQISIGVHEAARMVQEGCAPQAALRILT